MSEWDFSRQNQLDAELSNLEDYSHIIYLIRHKETEYYYIGQVSLWKTVKYPPLKGRTNKRHKLKKSDWRNYWGSSELFRQYVEQEGEGKFERIVLQAIPFKKKMQLNKNDANSAELRTILLQYDGLDDPKCFNCLIRNTIQNHNKPKELKRLLK